MIHVVGYYKHTNKLYTSQTLPFTDHFIFVYTTRVVCLAYYYLSGIYIIIIMLKSAKHTRELEKIP